MTNTDSRELDEILKIPLLGGDIQELADAILAYTANKQLEARIDELTWVLDKLIANDVHFPHTQVEIEDHIAKLKALGNTNL